MRNQRRINVEKYTKAVACQIYHSKKESVRLFVHFKKSEKVKMTICPLKIMQMLRDLVTLLNK